MASVFKRKGKGPWIIRWYDVNGRLHEKSSRTTDKRAADRIASTIASGVALRREGVIDPKLDKFSQASARPLQEHIDAYLVHKELLLSPRTVADARNHLRRIADMCKATRLADLSLDAVERALKLMKAEKKSVRTINHLGGSVRTFLEWCVDTQRLPANPLQTLVQRFAKADRKRIRRPLTSEELDRLFAVAEAEGRKLWYMLAYFAGLRRSDLKRIRWSSVDLARAVITIRDGKADREDEIPIHRVLLAELDKCCPSRTLTCAAIFPKAVKNETRIEDFRRAGIRLVDDQKRVADLHSLRVTLATNLALAGVPPQILSKIMRHSSASTTERYYIHLRNEHTASAIEVLPLGGGAEASPHHSPHQSQHEQAQHRAS